MPNITGGCLCGRVRYTITAEPIGAALCHCRDCQRYTGSGFEPFVRVPTSALQLQGELKSYTAPGGSGHALIRRFCPNCGSGVINEAQVRPGVTVVLAGTFDDPTAFVPTFEQFCADSPPWVQAGEERARFPKGRPMDSSAP